MSTLYNDRVTWLTENMRVARPDSEGVSYVEILGLPVGMFRQHPSSPNWQFQYLTHDGFKGGWNELAPCEVEHAEHWATVETAHSIAAAEKKRADT